MKKTSNIKRALLQVTFVATILLIASCGTNQQQNRSDENYDDNDQYGDNRESDNNQLGNNTRSGDNMQFGDNDQRKDADFLVNAAETNMEEIQLGKLAQQKGGTAEVKELGKMMVDVHTKSLNDLRALAERKMISIPTSSNDDAQEAYQDLNEESGSDFDKAYVDKMVSTHEDAIERYEDASTDSNDADIKNWAIAALPGLRTHLNHAIDFQNKLISSN